ncbi:MAG: hypothetical protein P8X78_05345, partial [Nitrosopumilaceae archaeon]
IQRLVIPNPNLHNVFFEISKLIRIICWWFVKFNFSFHAQNSSIDSLTVPSYFEFYPIICPTIDVGVIILVNYISCNLIALTIIKSILIIIIVSEEIINPLLCPNWTVCGIQDIKKISVDGCNDIIWSVSRTLPFTAFDRE